MPDTNPFTRAADRLAVRLADAAEDAAKSKAIPFGMKWVSPDTEAKAVAAMNREAKAKFLEQHSSPQDPTGINYALKVAARSRKNGTT